MAPLSVAGALFVTWTDPIVLGSGLIGASLLAVTLLLYSNRSSTESEATEPDAQEEPADAGEPEPTPVDPAQRAKKAREKAKERESAARSASPENLARGKGRSLAEMAANEEVEDTELMSRFVLNSQGEELGETLTVTQGEVILKRDGEFYAVEPDAIIEKNGTLLADANIDWDKAREAGKAWEDQNLDRMEYDDTGMPKQG